MKQVKEIDPLKSGAAPQGLAHDKSQIRNRMNAMLVSTFGDLDFNTRNKMSEALAQFIKTIVPAQKVVASFNARFDELNINAFLDMRRNTFVYPRVEGELIKFYKTLSEGDFVEGAWGILEPHPDRSTPVSPSEIDVMLVPGLAFDRQLMRLGRGRGFYDRYLQDFKGLKIGVCLMAQVLNQPLPAEKHDQAMDVLVTEEFVLQRRAA